MPITIITGAMEYRDAQGNYHNLECIKGEKGDTGDTGPQGATGATGHQGPQGEAGDPTTLIDDSSTAANRSWSASKLNSSFQQIGGTMSVYDTASGIVASFADGAENVPVKDMTVQIDPVQDLHGYSSPWVAGGGINKLPCGGVFDSTNKGIRFVSNGNGTYTITGTATADAAYDFNIEEVTFPSTVYIHFLNTATTYQIAFAFFNGTTQIAAPTPSSASRIADVSSSLGGQTVNKLRLYVANGYTADMTISPMICTDDTVRTFAPYSNICPITGWTGANVTRTGKNMIDATPFSRIHRSVDFAFNGSHATITGTATGGDALTDPSIASRYDTMGCGPYPAGTYTIGADGFPANLSGNTRLVCNLLYPDNSAVVSGFRIGGSGAVKKTFTATRPFKLGLYCHIISGDTINAEVDIQLEVGSTATAYEPYTGFTRAVSFGSAGTVYGGTLNVTTGLLTVDRAFHDGSTFTQYGQNNGFKAYRKQNVADASSTPEAISSGFSPDQNISFSSASLTKELFRVANNATTIYIVAKEDRDISNISLCYKLANPQTYSLTATQVTTLLGNNNIWSDTGNTSVTYQANTKMYIDRKLAELAAQIVNA